MARRLGVCRARVPARVPARAAARAAAQVAVSRRAAVAWAAVVRGGVARAVSMERAAGEVSFSPRETVLLAPAMVAAVRSSASSPRPASSPRTPPSPREWGAPLETIYSTQHSQEEEGLEEEEEGWETREQMMARIEAEERARLSHYSTLDRPRSRGEEETGAGEAGAEAEARAEAEADAEGEAGEQRAESEEEEEEDTGNVAWVREQEEDWETGDRSNSETDETRLSSRRDAARVIDAHAQMLMFNEPPPSALPPTLDPPGLAYAVPHGFALVPVRAAPPTPPDSESDGPDSSPAADANVGVWGRLCRRRCRPGRTAAAAAAAGSQRGWASPSPRRA